MNRNLIRQVSLEHLWAVAIILGVFVFVNTQPIRPHDFWWHLAVGRDIVTSGKIPTNDIYSFTMAGTPYPSYQMFWLADVSLYSLFQFGGPALVIFTQSLIITASYGLLLCVCWKESKSWRIAAVATIFAVALGIHNWNVRPQTISYLIGTAFLVAIYSYRQKSQNGWLVVFPLGMLVWVNSHGSFVIGLVLIGIWLADELWKQLVAKFKKEEFPTWNSLWAPLIAIGLTLLACLANPRGVGIISYVQTLSGNPVVQDLVPEWAPPNFDNLYGTIFLVALMLSSTILSISPKRPSFFHLVTFLAFGILGLKTTRGVIWFGIVMAPIISNHIAALVVKNKSRNNFKRHKRGTNIANIGILFLLILISVLSLPWFKHFLPLPKQKAGLISFETPIQATEFLKSDQFPGELFHDIGFGSYLIWAAQPEYKVFTDPRIELYPRDMWWDYVAVVNALPDWDAILSRYDVNTLMLNPIDQSNLIAALDNSPDWRQVYEDDAAVVYTIPDR